MKREEKLQRQKPSLAFGSTTLDTKTLSRAVDQVGQRSRCASLLKRKGNWKKNEDESMKRRHSQSTVCPRRRLQIVPGRPIILLPDKPVG